MRTGSRKIGRNRKTSGTPPDEERPRSRRSGPGSGSAASYRGKRTGPGSAPSRDRKPDGERPARKPYGDRPFSKSGSKPFGDKRKSFGKTDDKFSKDKPRFNREGSKPYGERAGGFKKPFGKFSGENKPERREGDAPSDERPARNYRSAKPYAGSSDRKPFGDKRKSFGKPDGRFDKDKPRFQKRNNESNPNGNPSPLSRKGSRPESGGSEARKPYGEKRSFDKPAARFDKDKPRYGNEGSKPFSERAGGYKKPFGKFAGGSKSESPQGEDAPKWNRQEKHEFYGDRKKRPRTFSKAKTEAEPKIDDGTVRLNKYISNAGICSRREADELITAGVISVNGEVVTTLGYKVQPTDVVKYNDAKLKSEKPVYLLLNKPKDFITTVDDPQNRQTVMSLIKHACKERVYPVGRLDRNTTGLLLFTNDGDLADKLTHPSFEVQKVYEVHLDKNLKHEHFEEIGSGVTLEDGIIKPDEISYSPDDKSIVGIELHSGRNRIVRRIFEHFGYRVSKLDRVLYAGLTKKDLPRGKWRFLTELELANLKMMTGNKRFKAAPKRIALAEE